MDPGGVDPDPGGDDPDLTMDIHIFFIKIYHIIYIMTLVNIFSRKISIQEEFETRCSNRIRMPPF